ncbi:MAG: hypothetical protein H8F28_19115, partial [Fibrella sp.]|nr:hypothetical protein [Armatimonadota bacterium]
MNETLLLLLLKSAVLSAFALTILGLSRRFGPRWVSAAARHLLCVGAFAALVLLPVLSLMLPAWRVVSVASPGVPPI